MLIGARNRFSWAFELASTGRDVFDQRQLAWECLNAKARSPTGYVPSIIDCEILAAYSDDCFRRRIRRDGVTIIQDVSADIAQWNIDFVHLEDPNVEKIFNRLHITRSGGLLYEMGVVNTNEWVRLACVEINRFADQCAYFEAAITAAGHRLLRDVEKRHASK